MQSQLQPVFTFLYANMFIAVAMYTVLVVLLYSAVQRIVMRFTVGRPNTKQYAKYGDRRLSWVEPVVVQGSNQLALSYKRKTYLVNLAE